MQCQFCGEQFYLTEDERAVGAWLEEQVCFKECPDCGGISRINYGLDVNRNVEVNK